MTTPSFGDVPFASLGRVDGYLPLADHGLIGNGLSAALVGRDGTIDWMCAPTFDSAPLFASILDARRGGRFLIAPRGVVHARQTYLEDTAVLVTELETDTARVRLTDAILLDSETDLTAGLRPPPGALLRCVEVLDGTAEIEVELEPRGNTRAASEDGVLTLRWGEQPDLDLSLRASVALGGMHSTHSLRSGDRIDMILSWEGSPPRPGPELIEATAAAWRRWLSSFHYVGPQGRLVRRSAITLKMLDYLPNGAIVAAPTSSLPEAIGGTRNWDYRYTWIRDAAFSVYALRRIGLEAEAGRFLRWVLDRLADVPLNVVHRLDGSPPLPERIDETLEGYRASAPVRWGNAAAEQRQQDMYGEILDCAFQWAVRGGEFTDEEWRALKPLMERAAENWRQPGRGIWEVRVPGAPFTYSAALCSVALDRGARLAERFGLSGDAGRWKGTAEHIRDVILEEAWNEERDALSGWIGGRALDASVLALPLRRVVSARHPKMVATTEAIREHLSAGDGLLYRYRVEETADGVGGPEGAFLLCSFWLVDNYAHQGRLDQALELFDDVCARANPLGLLPEQVDPSSGEFLGNFPQALSHVGLISSAVSLTRILAQQHRNGEEPAIPLEEAFKTAAMAVPSPGHDDDEDGSATP